jgi:hypothetical protein
VRDDDARMAQGSSIAEIPIVFFERQAGQTNLNFKKLLQGFFMILWLKILHLLRAENARF